MGECTFKRAYEIEGSENGSGIYKYEKKDGKIKIISYKGNEKNIVIPDTIDGMPVTEIGDYAFGTKLSEEYVTALSVTIPDTVEIIGEGAFASTEAKNIVLPKNLIRIGKHAFPSKGFCKKLIIPSGLKSVSEITENELSVEEFISESENQYFYTNEGLLFSADRKVLIKCPSMTKKEVIDIPMGTETISDYAFYGCKNVKKITIPDTVINIGKGAFLNLHNLWGLNAKTKVPFLSEKIIEKNTFIKVAGSGEIDIDNIESSLYRILATTIYGKNVVIGKSYDRKFISKYIEYIKSNTEIFISDLCSDKTFAKFVLNNIRLDEDVREKLISVYKNDTLLVAEILENSVLVENVSI